MTGGSKVVVPNAPPGVQLPPLSASICKVKALLAPVPESQIQVEVWLPETWNGKLVGTGGGGFSGGLGSAPILLNPLVGKGYAAAASDVGHPASDDAKWAYKHPVQLVDWAHRGNHVTAQFAKALATEFYAKPLQRSYFWGCSNGGRDALMEAWRYPGDYDGIVAGAPAAPWTRDMMAMAWNIRALDGPPAVRFTPAKLKLVNDAVMARCDTLDGVKDGVLEDPRACHFDPSKLQCKSGEGADCLSAAEVKALKAIYQGPRTRDGKQVSAGFPAGGETVEWAGWITNPNAQHRLYPAESYRRIVYEDPSWSLDRFDLDRDYPAAAKVLGPVVDSDNPDIRPFLRHGGKLVLYHGWADAALPPGNTITYYDAVKAKAGAAAASQVRLFMIPGGAHCFGGAGPTQVDWVDTLDSWFATGRAPERIVAVKPENPMAAFLGQPTKAVRTRPLCAWPKRAHWNGSGSTDDAANFSCAAPKE
jgi:feruloyl esterase